MEALLALDRSLFIRINHLPHPALLDTIALLVSGIGSFGLIWVCAAWILFLREEKKHHSFFLPIFTALSASYLYVEYFFKEIVARPRPASVLPAIIVDRITEGFSFPSGHATVAFAGAVVMSAYDKRYKWWFYGMACLIALSRVYLGKHYPSDIIAGAVVGFLIGKISLSLTHPKKILHG